MSSIIEQFKKSCPIYCQSGKRKGEICGRKKLPQSQKQWDDEKQKIEIKNERALSVRSIKNCVEPEWGLTLRKMNINTLNEDYYTFTFYLEKQLSISTLLNYPSYKAAIYVFKAPTATFPKETKKLLIHF